MMNRLRTFFQNHTLYLWLLPVFFVLHGSRENYDFVPVTDALQLIGVYLLSALILLLIFRLICKSWPKAALMSFILMAFNFFFGSVHDGLRKIFPGSFLTKYVFILPLLLCLLILVFILIKKRKKPLLKLSWYLNILFALFIFIDAAWLVAKVISFKNPVTASEEFIACNDCTKPDVYIIIADEYIGNSELKDVFHFDNSGFSNQLTERGFHIIPNSSSNYNYTPYSIASTLNMDYLDLQRSGKQPLLPYTYETIRDNRLLNFFQDKQYKFYNYSFLDFKGHPSYTKETFLPVKTTLITSQTFLSRIEKELRYHLISDLKWKKEIRKWVYNNDDNNRKLIQLTTQTAKEKIKQSKFVLTHLMMPHYPYYYDKNGNEYPFEMLVEGNQNNQSHYIEYLQYSNKKLLQLIDDILTGSPSPPIVILMGDHGFRHFTEPVDPKYFFLNMVSIHLPVKNYSAFTDSLTNVNLMRALLNTSFGQQLPYLKDTTFIMKNP